MTRIVKNFISIRNKIVWCITKKHKCNLNGQINKSISQRKRKRMKERKMEDKGRNERIIQGKRQREKKYCLHLHLITGKKRFLIEWFYLFFWLCLNKKCLWWQFNTTKSKFYFDWLNSFGVCLVNLKKK